MPVNGIELKEGQKWKTLYGRVATLQDNPRAKSYIFRAVYEDGGWNTVTEDGKLWTIDYDSFLIELIYDPEQVKEKLTMKFKPKSEPTKFVPPKPGDKIICNNGEEFICCTEEFLMSEGYWIHGNEIIFGYSNNPENGTAGVYWNTWNQAGESTGASLPWYIREVIPQSAESSAEKKEEVKEEPRYTVEEVIEAFSNALHLSWMGGHKEGIEKVKDYLEKKSNKEYQEYLRLKAIYE